jgi:hypothetical protein
MVGDPVASSQHGAAGGPGAKPHRAGPQPFDVLGLAPGVAQRVDDGAARRCPALPGAARRFSRRRALSFPDASVVTPGRAGVDLLALHPVAQSGRIDDWPLVEGGSTARGIATTVIDGLPVAVPVRRRPRVLTCRGAESASREPPSPRQWSRPWWRAAVDESSTCPPSRGCAGQMPTGSRRTPWSA